MGARPAVSKQVPEQSSLRASMKPQTAQFNFIKIRAPEKMLSVWTDEDNDD